MRRALLLPIVLAACGAPRTQEPARCALTLQPAATDLSVVADGGCAGSLQLTVRIATGAPEAPSWNPPGQSPVQLGGGWVVRDDAAVRTVTVTNPGSTPVSLVGIEWSTPPGGLGVRADRLLNNGYQSWSYSGVLRIPSALPDALGTAPHGGDNEDLTGELRGVSWWWTWLGDASGAGLVAGADGATVFKTTLAVDAAPQPRLRIVQGLTGDALVLAPGQTVSLDGLWLSFGDATNRLDAYAAAVAVAALHPPARPRQAALGGWGSWNLYYASPTAAALRTEAQWATQQLLPLGLTDFLLDDGYEPHWGNWSAAPGFGAQLDVLNAEQAAAGLRPAVWLAPFYVDLTDPLVTAHPDWFVHRVGGGLRTFTNFGPSYAALDVSHPGARAHVTSALQQLRSWGYRSFKLDFLFGGAIEGVRQEPLTGLQSYARWMKVLRDAVPDAHLVGCGAPLLPSVGTFDSMRTGADIALSVGPEPSFPFIASQGRQTITRAATDRWWSLDPDVVLLRGTQIDDVEAWTAVVSSALAGGNYLLGDGRQSTPLRQAMALAPQLLAVTRDGRAARAEDLVAQTEADVVASPLLVALAQGQTRAPHRWKKVSADGAHTALAVFAWDVAGYETSVELPAGAKELVAGNAPPLTLEPISGRQTIQVPRHGARLFLW